jgi:hypothetical protein
MPATSIVLSVVTDPADATLAGRAVLDDGATRIEATFTVPPATKPQDFEDARWLLEDFGRLRSAAAEPLALRISDRLLAIGTDLGASILGASAEGRRIADILARSPMDLHVRIGDRGLSGWTPWELLTVPPAHPLALLAASFVRFDPDARPAAVPFRSTTADQRQRILFITARPHGEEDVPFRSVGGRVVQALANRHDALFDLEVLRPPTYAALARRLERALASDQPYDIVHFDGHGGSYPQSDGSQGRRGFLFFEGDSGDDYTPVDGGALGALLVRNKVSLLLLNACRSAFVDYQTPLRPQDASDDEAQPALGSVAIEVMKSGLRGVLAMAFNVYVLTSAQLVADTYAGLAAGLDLASAVAKARRQLADRTSGTEIDRMEWLVPVVYVTDASASAEAVAVVPELPVALGTSTPASSLFVDLLGHDGPRSAARPFVGFDNAILRLERVFRAQRAVEVVGLAGAGKSCLCAEFARWVALTGGWNEGKSSPAPIEAVAVVTRAIARIGDRLAVAVLDFAAAVSLDDIAVRMGKTIAALAGDDGETGELQSMADFIGAVGNLNRGAAVLWVVDDFAAWHDRQAAQGATAAAENAQALIHEMTTGYGRVLMCGRSSARLVDFAVVSIPALDREARFELARLTGLSDGADPAAIAQVLDWSAGLPGLIVRLKPVLDAATLGASDAMGAMLRRFRFGHVDEVPAFGRLMAEFAFPASPRVLPYLMPPLAFTLFNGWVDRVLWDHFCRTIELQTAFAFPKDGSSWFDRLVDDSRFIEKAGLVCPVGKASLQIHPLAPAHFDREFYGIAVGMSGRDPRNVEAVAQVAGLFYSGFCMTVATLAGQGFIRDPTVTNNGGGAIAGIDIQNIIHAAEVAVDHKWWNLFFPLARRYRAVLTIEGRRNDWLTLLNAVSKGIPPDGDKAAAGGLIDPNVSIMRLIAEEVEQEGDLEAALHFQKVAAAMQAQRSVTVEPLSGEGPVMDVGRRQEMLNLERSGELLAARGAAQCMDAYERAHAIALSLNDGLEAGRIELSMARAHLNVPELADDVRYEALARSALARAEDYPWLGEELTAEARNSIGQALVRQLASGRIADRDHAVQEARECLSSARELSTNANTRASALSGLAQLHGVLEEFDQSKDAFLEAAKEFEELGALNEQTACDYNAALALGKTGRVSEMTEVARAALERLDQSGGHSSSHRRALLALIQFGEGGKG